MVILMLLLSASLILSFTLRAKSTKVKCLSCHKDFHPELIAVFKVFYPDNENDVDFLAKDVIEGVCVWCFFTKDKE